MLCFQVENSTNDQGKASGTAKLPNLHSLILDKFQYITLSDAGQHSTRMMHYFHHQQNCFLDYFNDPVPGDAVIYVGNIPFWYSEREGTYTELLDDETENAFLTQLGTMDSY